MAPLADMLLTTPSQATKEARLPVQNPLGTPAPDSACSRGLESQGFPVISGSYLSTEGDKPGSTQPADASKHVETDPNEDDVSEGPSPLPAPTAELFIFAGVLAAEHAARGHAGRSRVEEVLPQACPADPVFGKDTDPGARVGCVDRDASPERKGPGLRRRGCVGFPVSTVILYE